MEHKKLHSLQKLIIVLSIVGIGFVVSGLVIDDVTFWAIADSVFISVFLGSAIVSYLSWKKHD